MMAVNKKVLNLTNKKKNYEKAIKIILCLRYKPTAPMSINTI